MKKLFITAFTAIFLVACKPTETNYRKAYETTKAHVAEEGIIDGTIYEAYRAPIQRTGLVLNGDTIPMLTFQYRLSAGLEVPSTLTKYCVALGQFKQRFNALSLMNRLQKLGYKESTIVQNAEPLYYVVIPGAANADEAVALYNAALTLSDSIKIIPPYPVVMTK